MFPRWPSWSTIGGVQSPPGLPKISTQVRMAPLPPSIAEPPLLKAMIVFSIRGSRPQVPRKEMALPASA